MAEVKGEYIAVNELKASAKDAKKMMFEGQNIRIAWAEGKRVWDVWETILSASNFSVPATATTLTKTLLNLQSYGTDRLGVQHDMEYTISPTSISVNTSTSSRTQSVTIKQTKTDKSISVTATQAGNVQTTTYENFRITSFTYSSDVSAGGGTVYPTINYAYDKVVTNSNGMSKATTPMTGSVSSCKVTSYSTSSSYIGSVNTSNGSVYASSLYTTPKSRSSIALIYGISITVYIGGENRTMTYSTSRYVYQQANSKTTYSSGYSLSFTTSRSTMDAVGGSVTLSVIPYYVTYYRWTSGSDGGSSSSVSSSNVTLQRTSGNGTLSKTSITGQGTATYTMYNNDVERTVTHTIKATLGSYDTETVTITQAAGVYEFYFEDYGTIPYTGGSIQFELISRLNGVAYEVIEESVTLDGEMVDSVIYSENSETYRVRATFPANTSTTNTKTYTLSAQQYATGKVTTLKVTQAKQTVSDVKGRVTITNLVDGLYISGGYLYGFNSYPRFTITASGGTLPACKYKFALYFEIYTDNGDEFHPQYVHELEYIEPSAFSGTKTIYFADFPAFFSFEELIGPVFDPYFMNVESVVVRAELQYVSGTGRLYLDGSMEDYTWYV